MPKMFEAPNRRRIYLMRHGEAAYVRKDGTETTDPDHVPLTPLGEEQASTQGKALNKVQFDRAICSGLPRTVSTATLVLAENAHPTPTLEIESSLVEVRADSERFRTLPQDPEHARRDIAELGVPWGAGEAPDGRFLGGELFREFDERIAGGFDGILADPEWRTLLLVLHGAVNRSILNRLSGLTWQGNFSFEQDNACINIIDLDLVDDDPAGRVLLRGINLTAYNLAKEGMTLTHTEHAAQRLAKRYADT